MSWTTQIFAYCERGLDPSLWAEPLNTLTNLAFFAAGLSTLSLRQEQPPARRDPFELGLVLLIFAIGIGSLLFHTLAVRWAAVADTVPIGIFMVAYLVYALRRFLGLGLAATTIATMVFVATLPPASMIRCGGGPCLNGSVAYLPALMAMLIVGGILMARGHAAGRSILTAAWLFLVSLSLRSIDRMVCPYTTIASMQAVGTHFLWHLLNATLLFILVRAALLHGAPAPRTALQKG